MTVGFDAAAATAAYLAQVPPAAHARAQAYTQGGHWLLLWGALVTVAAAWLILRSGVLVKARARLEAKGPRPWRSTLAVLALALALTAVLELPWTIYRDWQREKSYGLTSQPFGGWFGEWAMSSLIGLVMTLVLLSLVYWLIRRAPRTWWAWSGGVVAVFIFLVMAVTPVFIEPLFNTYRPAPAGPVRDAVAAMARANGVPEDKIFIYDGSRQSNRYTANVSGLFGTARVAMSDVMFKKDADLAEVKAVVGHEMGHYSQKHLFWMVPAISLLVLAGFFLTDRLFPAVARLTGARGVQGLSDPAGYPVIAMILAVLALIATPAFNSISRIGEEDADQFSLERVNEPDGMAKALAKTIEYRAATPSKLEEVLFYSHPAVGNRIRRAMEWKATHPPAGVTAS